ncbi:MGH1-like glycoside hydrolase domain-containing protein [Jiella mangrovi]|uniref:Glucosidase n=1 Tax=Jiella mangrovi TaxID=2821407 RepID=A0ABS4BMD3_9HYPH|nr:glucosidase [Jiella mangrovi]MBP0617888.1 glucosidase [Jiella mangrovi]
MAAKPNHTHSAIFDTAEGRRVARASQDGWRRWGPYLAERQWGTVREDYSADGDAWSYLPHDEARSRAYRWGEDGIAGFCDEGQHWCLSLGLWNGADPIVKERLFGLANAEGNHGEDVKELWWHLDAVPSHAFQRMLYRYPQGRFPYDELIAENARRKGRDEPEYELEDTGILSENRFFDVTVDYAKDAPDEILMRVTVVNRGPQTKPIHILPQLVARNIWSWREGAQKPTIAQDGPDAVSAVHPSVPEMRFTALQPATWLFCENETNIRRLYGEPVEGAFKDAINDHVVGANASPLPSSGTKCAALSVHELQPGASVFLRYRFAPPTAAPLDVTGFDSLAATRQAEADSFYAALQRDMEDDDARLVQRRALAGLLWSKQTYRYNVKRWLDGDPAQPTPPPQRRNGRNADWTSLDNAEVILMPDTWEYPWYASWDLAFHAMAAALVDPALAKEQLLLLTREWYMHPNGQIPAYEWDFSDGNPPIQAFAALRVFRMDKAATGKADLDFLERLFHKLTINFTWWVNRKDSRGRNLFQGGFLGLDNIGVFDRSAPLPGGGTLEQADGTAWMAMYALNLMRMALELAERNPVYEDIATKFFEHFLVIASAMARVGPEEGDEDGLWDEEDGFFYDALVLPDGTEERLRVRSLVGLIPLCAVEVLEKGLAERHPDFSRRLGWMLRHRPDLTGQVSHYEDRGQDARLLLSLLRAHRMRAILTRMLDEAEFLSPFGLRSLSKAHGRAPFTLDCDGINASVDYEPGTSTSGIFGGNSNWRGPVWMPLNVMIVEALAEFDRFYGDGLTVECPTGSGQMARLSKVADELSRRLTSLFLKDAKGERAALGGEAPRSADGTELIVFNEYFHGETGQGLGASHQTGWTALVALLLQNRR